MKQQKPSPISRLLGFSSRPVRLLETPLQRAAIAIVLALELPAIADDFLKPLPIYCLLFSDLQVLAFPRRMLMRTHSWWGFTTKLLFPFITGRGATLALINAVSQLPQYGPGKIKEKLASKKTYLLASCSELSRTKIRRSLLEAGNLRSGPARLACSLQSSLHRSLSSHACLHELAHP